MALIRCPKCGKEIETSDGLNACSNCGYPISGIKADESKNIALAQKKNEVKEWLNLNKQPAIKKLGFAIIAIGIIMLIVGVALKTPGTALTTYSSLDGNETSYGNGRYSSIEEYVGGDAYNYIIGASLIGGKIAGMIAAKAICMTVGIFIACIGAICVFIPVHRPTDKVSAVLLSEEAVDVPKSNL